jgi:hypothetical protein
MRCEVEAQDRGTKIIEEERLKPILTGVLAIEAGAEPIHDLAGILVRNTDRDGL